MRREGKLGEKSTSHTRQTGKCKKPRCRLCHTAPLNKSMGKSKGEWKMKHNDINSNYLMHDWRLCQSTSSLPQSAGRNRPKVKVGSPSSVWTSALNYYEDTLDVSESADDYEAVADSGATLFGGTTFGAPPKRSAVLIPTSTTRGHIGSRKKSATSEPEAITVEAEEAPLQEDVGAKDVKPHVTTSCIGVSEALSETLCFGTIGAVGEYWKTNISFHSCIALANEWPHVDSKEVSDTMQDPIHEKFGACSDNDIEDSELLFLHNIQVPGEDSENDYVTDTLNDGSNGYGLEGVMAKICSQPTTLDHQDDSEFEKTDSHLDDIESDSNDSWSDVVDAEDSSSEDWCLMDVEENYLGEDRKISFKAVAN